MAVESPTPELPQDPAPPSTTTHQLTEAEVQALQEFRNRGSSPTKKLKPSPQEEDSDSNWSQFLEALQAKDIELMDLDPALLHTFRTNPQARDDFIALNLLQDNAQHFDPEKGAHQHCPAQQEETF